MKLTRRAFIGTSAAGVADMIGSRLFAAEPARSIAGIFESSDPAMLKLAEEVYSKCVLDKLMPPEGTLKHKWITAGGHYYGQWLWDTIFVVDMLSFLPDMELNIRDVFQNFWDFQVRWNEKTPPYAHDMVPYHIQPKNYKYDTFPAFSQIPILAWGMERVYQRNGDKELLRQGLAPLERFHEWFWRERDVTDVGLIAVGSYSGKIQHGRYETFDNECNLDSLQLTVHPTRKGDKEGAWYGDICASGNTAYLVTAENSLMRLAEQVGDKAMANRRKARIDKSVAAMPMGVPWYGMSCSILEMILDGLCRRYELRVKK